jgi:ABC-type multidrug transport system fused ATPase/permease subunit
VEFLDDIHALPHGFNTRIGAGGLSFSGGQRQRIGLARALLREPDILILDEAMSALEPSREQRIRERIAARMQDKTVLVVSHRADAAVGADAVIEIDGGRVTGVVSVSGG